MERRGAIVGNAFAVFLLCLLLDPLNLTQFNFSENHDASVDSPFRPSLCAFIPLSVLGTAKKCASKKFGPNKRSSPIRSTRNKGKVDIFTGIEAKTDHAIFEILDANGPLSIRELLKLLNRHGLDIPYYSSLNKRIHALERGNYIGQVNTSPNGSRATLYDLRPKFYLARFLNSNSPDEILSRLTDTDAEIILADLVNPSVQTS